MDDVSHQWTSNVDVCKIWFVLSSGLYWPLIPREKEKKNTGKGTGSIKITQRTLWQRRKQKLQGVIESWKTLLSGHEIASEILRSRRLKLPALDLTRLVLPIITAGRGRSSFMALYFSPIHYSWTTGYRKISGDGESLSWVVYSLVEPTELVGPDLGGPQRRSFFYTGCRMLPELLEMHEDRNCEPTLKE